MSLTDEKNYDDLNNVRITAASVSGEGLSHGTRGTRDSLLIDAAQGRTAIGRRYAQG
jgi:hypothetical protein